MESWVRRLRGMEAGAQKMMITIDDAVVVVVVVLRVRRTPASVLLKPM